MESEFLIALVLQQVPFGRWCDVEVQIIVVDFSVASKSGENKEEITFYSL